MATVAHTIYSHYSPPDKGPEKDVPPDGEQVDPALAWQKEASKISGRSHVPPPNFVPATISYGDWGGQQAGSSNLSFRDDSLGGNLAGWYRSLTSSHSTRASPSSLAKDGDMHPSVSLSMSSTTPYTSSTLKGERSNKNNWFIMKAIQSELPSSSNTPPPTLADILARDPPALPSEGKFYPPVWLAIGPSNKGFSMLQQGGWNEGEPLGPDVVRRKPMKEMIPEDDVISFKDKGKGKANTRNVQDRCKIEDCEDVNESRNVEVIDLTLSDFDDDDDDDTDVNQYQREESLMTSLSNHPPTDVSAHGGKALLTPIATVLKSDRLGIGLKAKTAGPYKASQKRVTHNAEAMAAHVKAAEEARKRKETFGRGRRGFKRQRNMEETKRKAMLAYLNT